MPIVEIRKSNINLWDEYPDLDIISEFKKLRKEEGDERSNNILKAIYYIWDVKSDKRDSGFTEEELIKDVNENLLNDKNFDWSKREELKEAWFKYCMSETDRLLKRYRDEIEDFNTMMKEWKWDKKTAQDKAMTMKSAKSMFEDLKEIEKLFVAEKIARLEMQGRYTPSLLEEEAYE